MIWCSHQSGTGITLRDLLGRASHIDVDNRRALPFDHACSFGHRGSFASGKLHCRANFSETQLGLFSAARSRIQHIVACHHLGHDQTCAKRRHKCPERHIRNPGHRGQQNRRRYVDWKVACAQLLNPWAFIGCYQNLPLASINQAAIAVSDDCVCIKNRQTIGSIASGCTSAYTSNVKAKDLK